jgi:hypothetical protein
MKEFTVPVEFGAALQQARPDTEPFQSMLVAAVLVDRDAVQVEFFLVPAADDVEAGSAVGDVVDGGDRLSGERRRYQRHMNGREDRDASGQRAECSAMGQRFEGTAVDVGLSLEAAPFCHWQDEFDPGFVGDVRHCDDVVPVRAPAFGGKAHRQSAVAVGAEDAEFEAVRSEEGVVGAGWVHVLQVIPTEL